MILKMAMSLHIGWTIFPPRLTVIKCCDFCGQIVGGGPSTICEWHGGEGGRGVGNCGMMHVYDIVYDLNNRLFGVLEKVENRIQGFIPYLDGCIVEKLIGKGGMTFDNG